MEPQSAITSSGLMRTLAAEFALGTGVLLGSAGFLALHFYPGFWNSPLQPRLVAMGWTAVWLTGYFLALYFLARTRPEAFLRAESRRWLTLVVVALFLLSGLIRPGMHGGGDARWYGTMLADMVTQIRAGVFPVWCGQSEYQFNGAVYPLRVAPGFHYLGALLDALSFHTLGIFALQNLLIVLLGLAGIFSAYFSLAALLPDRRSLAAGLAILFLACPGVLGIAYNSDLYMSWTTLPLVPLAWFASVRSFRDGGALKSMVLLGGSLGLCWWGHSPIALWLTICTTLFQVVRILAQRRDGRTWWNATGGALAFLLVAGYPLASVLFFPPEPGINGAGFQSPASATVIVDFLRGVFPATFLPLSENGRVLSDFQIGYALCGIYLFLSWHLLQVRRPVGLALLGVSVVLVLLLTPIPGLDLALWSAVPSAIRDITARWVMNRLYLVLAGAIVCACAVAIVDLLGAPRRERTLHWLIVLGCFWSVAEARKFSNGSRATAGNALSAPRSLPLENVMVTRYAYFVFPQPPAYFTNGVTDPSLENRLWRETDGSLLASNYAAALSTATRLTQVEFSRPLGEAVEQLPQSFPLEAKKRYLLAFDFSSPLPQGILQLTGTAFFREYGLPESGGAEAFGSANRNSHLLPLSTSLAAGDEITVRFIHAEPADKPILSRSLGRVSWLAYDPARLPIRIISWVPFRASVTAPEGAWLETPRMYQRGYVAYIGQLPAEVRKSPAGLLMIRVPQGNSEVELVYRPPLGLALIFWLSLASIAFGGGWLGLTIFRALAQNPSSEIPVSKPNLA